VYHEYTCVPVADNKLCIFNMIKKIGVVYNLWNDAVVPESLENLLSPETESGIMFRSLNLIRYAFEPNFVVLALPTTRSKEVTATVGPSIGLVATPVVN
jgi:hypothetical protein